MEDVNFSSPDRMMSPTDLRTSEDIEKLAKKKGRVYLCLRCLHKTGKERADVRYRMEAHIIKDHLRRDEVPYYCSLCQFRCTKFKDLNDHLQRYKRHSVIAVQAKVDPMDTSCLKTNADAYEIGPRDYLMLSREESIQHWRDLLLKRQATMEPEPDCLAKAMMQESIPTGNGTEAEMESPKVAERQATAIVDSIPEVQQNSFTPLTQPQMIDEVSGLTDEQLRQAMSPLLDQLHTIVGPSTLCRLVNVGVPATASVPQQPEPQAEKVGQEEDLMPQLLPREETAITPKRSAENQPTIIPQKKMRSRSPSPSNSTCSSTSSSFRQEKQEEVKAVLGVVVEQIRQNTKALQSLEQSVLTLAEAVTALTKATKGKDSMREQAVEAYTRKEKEQTVSKREEKVKTDRKRERSLERRDYNRKERVTIRRKEYPRQHDGRDDRRRH